MTKVFVEPIENDEQNIWGLFYYGDNGEKVPLKENWKHITFDKEDDAISKLNQIEAEYERENNAKPFSLDEAKAFAETHNWNFATTYAKSAPHEYIVKYWLSDDDKVLFERLVQTIRTYSVIGYFYGHQNNYLILDDHYYWYMDCYPDNMAVDLINRTTTDYLEYRDGAYYYKPKKNVEENINEPDRMQSKA